MSRPSTFPTYLMLGVCMRSWCASLTTALPFSSSSPTFRSPTPGCGHHRARVARRDEGVRFPLLLEPEPDRYGGPRLPLHSSQRLLAHADDFGRLHDLEPAAIDVPLGLERRFDVGGPPHELDSEA